MRNMSLKRFLIIGRANAGKTLFILNFAQYMGYRDLVIKIKNESDESEKSDSIEAFKRNIVNELPNTTKCLQIINIDMPVLKGKKPVEFIDTTGVSSDIHFDQDVRDGMVQTLMILRENNIIMHIIDVSSINEEKKIDNIDIEIYKYGKKRGNYLLLANKMDLDTFEKGFDILNMEIRDVKILKISAMNKAGFGEIKRHVSKLV